MKNTLTLLSPASWWAARWREALPAGNGHIGAAVYGAVREETIMLTHDDLWRCQSHQPLPDVSDRLPEVRRLMLDGQVEQAEYILSNALKEKGYRAVYAFPLPLGDLKIIMPARHAFKDYSRTLDMEHGQVRVGWRDGDTRYERALFVSRADDVVLCDIHASGPSPVDATIMLDLHDRTDAQKPFGFPQATLPEQVQTRAEVAADGAYVYYAARNDDGTDFGAVARVIHVGGVAAAVDSRHADGSVLNPSGVGVGEGIHVTGAERVTIHLKVFLKEARHEVWQRLRTDLAGETHSYGELLARHAALHGQLFRAAGLDLGADAAAHALPNEQLLLQAYQGEAPLALIEKMWAYGRYLLISSSREGGHPCPLQGLWGGEYDGFWTFNMANENIQEIYWQALSGNMPELLLTMFDYYDRRMDDFRTNARNLYGCRGIYICAVSMPGTGLLQDVQPHILHWTGAAGWLGQHYYDYYLFTGDERFLRERALPFLREVALFYEDFFIPGPDGYLMSVPSQSPENTPGNWLKPGQLDGIKTTINATLDFAIAKEVLTHLIEGAAHTGLYADEVVRWRGMLARIPPYQVNEDGAVKEWMHPLFTDNYYHRHQSHLYPVFPGTEITEEEAPDLLSAFGVAVKKRLFIGLKEQTSWSFAHMASIFARLGEGDLALECLDILSRAALINNFFTVYNDWRGMGISQDFNWAPFQIDANMGWTAAVQEMLLFSKPGLIKLLPGLPGKWTRGSVTGLLCRGSVRVNQVWNMSEGWLKVDLVATETQTVKLKTPKPIRTVTVNGQDYRDFHGQWIGVLHLSKGEPCTIEITFA